MLKWNYLVPVITACVGIGVGSFVAGLNYDARTREARYQNYTDRGRICLEAAALLRANQPTTAQRYLERHADAAIAGVAMWRAYDELSADSQALMVTAKLYDQSFDDVDFNLDRRIRGGSPDDHPWLSTNMRGIAARLGG